MSRLGLFATARRSTTVAVFAVALLARLLFWQATPDRDWPHSALYKGDALVWSGYAGALARGEPFELGLPLRPPGNGYLLHWLGVEGPGDAAAVKWIWCLLGAAAVALVHRAALAAFGAAVALITALWCALSTGLLMLSTSLNNETPYLVLVAAILWVAPRLVERPTAVAALGWGALNGLACLLRVEHLLFVLLASAWLVAVRWRREVRQRPRRLTRLALPLAAGFALVLVPWHLAAWEKIREFNHSSMRLDPAGEAAQRAIENAVRGLTWTPAARAEQRRLPAFARRPAANFVAATVLVRGGREVRAEDFAILDEAFGYRPRALPARPFVALYGPLNFYLANRAGAPPGFDPAGLDRLPPLAGGIDRYPRALLAGLPPRQLNFFYPPHLEAVTDGYRLGWRWIGAHPLAFARRAAARIDILWQGAALGWTGYGIPWEAGGLRRAVDLTVPEGRGFALWRLALALLCLAGLWRARAAPALGPWLAFAATKLAAAALFFGYARHGATFIPVVAALAAIALLGPAPSSGAPRTVPPRMLLAAAVLAALALGLEGHRWMRPPSITIDGAAVTAADPFPAGEFRDRRIRLE